ncbi:hypothetical protein [Candidatus Leptofilum sp.]|uniref:hypothetical protein n=1 Tax=Candidatus Leptofilum sp. TaxID=3241576 RepID=UPI003B5B267D
MKFDMDSNQNYGPANHVPYQCFMGRWEGLCKTFDAKGNFIEASAVHMNVYWIDEKTWHLHEYFENLYEFGPADIHSDITVEGKYCHGANEAVTIEGTEITPFNYVFTIVSQLSGTTVYNNHYFIDPNNRRIITHKVRDGKTHIFQIQDFVRIVQP